VRAGAYNILKHAFIMVTHRTYPQALSPSSSPPPIVSVDAPSGWHIENGPAMPASAGGSEPLAPDMLVSLTAPKKCAQHFKVSERIGWM